MKGIYAPNTELARLKTLPVRGVVPLRQLRHVPPSDSIATVMVNSLRNRVNSITPCITLNAKTEKIVHVTLCIQTGWLLCNVRLVWNCPTVSIDQRLNGLIFHFPKSSWRSCY